MGWLALAKHPGEVCLPIYQLVSMLTCLSYLSRYFSLLRVILF